MVIDLIFKKKAYPDESLSKASLLLNKEEYALYKPWEDLPEIAQHGVIAHELAHANSPTREDNDRLYGNREKREKSLDFVKKVAE